MEQPPVRGTVTPLSSIFPSEEAQKASKRVRDTISERRKELDQLQQFITDNTNLVNLVQKLPDELHHEIMVPFGKAAFFPGSLIHTNEFLVLLGEGYYADRTSKQTTEILKRRGKSLESQIESLKAVMQDLKAEASFFDTTAAESAEGLVEIREDYIEEESSEKTSITGKKKVDSVSSKTEINKSVAVVEDDEYARIISRIDELEKEELEAENEDEDEENEGDLGKKISELDLDNEVKTSEACTTSRKESLQDNFHENSSTQANVSNKTIASKFEGSKVLPASKVGSSLGNSPAIRTDKNLELQDSKKTIQEAPLAKNEAFTGSIVERTYGIGQRNPKEQSEVSGPSKPVSRFKMQRR